MKQWYEIKEQAAGEKRLWLMWYIYKFAGKKAINFIAFFVTFFTFIFAKDIRNYSKKYLKIIEPLTGIKPSIFNQFRHFLSYSHVLTDKVEIFSNNFDKEKVLFASASECELLYSDLDKQKGVFFICSHVGNTDVMRTFFINNTRHPGLRVNVFFSRTQSRIFNGFINKIAKEIPLNPYLVEEIGVNTAIQLKDSLDNGGIAFIAGDRVAENSNAAVFEAELFGHKVNFPVGSFKIAQLMEVPIYFIIALKTKKDTYTIHLEKHKFTTLSNLEQDYVKFLEKTVLLSPLQFYHFYDLFKN